MPRLSKVDECLNFHNYAVAKDPASNTQANQTTKQALLSVILEALPEKLVNPLDQDGKIWTNGYNQYRNDTEKALNKVFGVEG